MTNINQRSERVMSFTDLTEVVVPYDMWLQDVYEQAIELDNITCAADLVRFITEEYGIELDAYQLEEVEKLFATEDIDFEF